MVKSDVVPNRGGSWLIMSILILGVLLLSGYYMFMQLVHGQKIIKKQQGEITSLNVKIRSMGVQLAGVQQELKSQRINSEHRFATVNSSLNLLGTKYAVLNSAVNKYKKCIFHYNSKGVQRLDTDLGSLFVTLNGITAHHNHYVLSLNIGNPYMSEISGFTLLLKYGKAYNPSGSDSYHGWLKSLKTINKSFKKKLKPGQWNEITVSLGKLQPDEVKYITVEMMLDNIILKE